jgi:hypothetical protein
MNETTINAAGRPAGRGILVYKGKAGILGRGLYVALLPRYEVDGSTATG